jgi:hypothetical protein
MFSNKTLRPGSFRHHLARNVFALFVMFCLSTALFTGCGPSDYFDDHKLKQDLIGTWESEYYDGYTIKATHLSYGYGADSIEYAGIIKYVSNFSNTAGVIIIEYDTDHKPTYYAGYDPVTYEPIGDPLPLKGNFIGIYFDDFKPGVSVQMGGAYVAGGAEKATLVEAIATFTQWNEGTYMGYYGTYARK